MVGDPRSVALRNHQGNVIFVTKLRRVVDDHSARCRGPGRMFCRHRRTGREQSHLNLREIESREFLNLQRVAGEIHHAARGTPAG